ncbi:hypothetical protein ACSBR1_011727 [Camellia fascicularis]
MSAVLLSALLMISMIMTNYDTIILQYDAFDIGFITTDDFTNADILEATYLVGAKRLHSDWITDPAIPIVTGYLGKGWRSCTVTTLGRADSDLRATTIGKALGLQEIQVNVYTKCLPRPLTLPSTVTASHLFTTASVGLR